MVIGVSGMVKYAEENLRIGDKIDKSAEIQLTPNSYLSLLHFQGKLMELNKPGIYSISYLEDELLQKTAKDSLLVDFSYHPPVNFQTRLIRGWVEKKPSQFEIVLPRDSKVFQIKKIPLAWKVNITYSKPSSYLVSILNAYDEEINKYETTDTNTIVDLSSIEEIEDNFLMVEIANKNHPKIKERIAIQTLKDTDNEKFTQKYHLFQSQNKQTPNSLVRSINEAIFLERNNFLIEAILLYQNLNHNYPQSSILKKCLHLFMLRHNIAPLWLEKIYQEK
jgi:hypothetical protein